MGVGESEPVTMSGGLAKEVSAKMATISAGVINRKVIILIIFNFTDLLSSLAGKIQALSGLGVEFEGALTH